MSFQNPWCHLRMGRKNFAICQTYPINKWHQCVIDEFSMGHKFSVIAYSSIALISHLLYALITDQYHRVDANDVCLMEFKNKENTPKVTWMTFSDFVDLKDIIIGSNCCGRSGWIFSLAPVVKPVLDYTCNQLVKFGEFFKYPWWQVFGLFVQGLKGRRSENSPAWAAPWALFLFPIYWDIKQIDQNN